MITAIKVHWFRTSATKSRWAEEKGIVCEEMKRVVRSFKFNHHRWLKRGHELEAKSLGGAAYARK